MAGCLECGIFSYGEFVKIEVEIPGKDKVLAGGYSVPLARKGDTWSGKSLGHYAKDKGVYIIHHAGTVKYVGKTDRPSMSFGMRLRREFQETASQRRHIYPKLEALKVPPEIKVYFFTSEEIRGLVSGTSIPLTDMQRIAIFETALVQVYEPEFQAYSLSGEAKVPYWRTERGKTSAKANREAHRKELEEFRALKRSHGARS